MWYTLESDVIYDEPDNTVPTQTQMHHRHPPTLKYKSTNATNVPSTPSNLSTQVPAPYEMPKDLTELHTSADQNTFKDVEDPYEIVDSDTSNYVRALSQRSEKDLGLVSLEHTSNPQDIQLWMLLQMQKMVQKMECISKVQ